MQSEMVNSLALALLSTALAPWAWFVSSHADVYADTEHAETIGALEEGTTRSFDTDGGSANGLLVGAGASVRF